MTRCPRLCVILLSLFACVPAVALELVSGERRTQLIELYTSEGCSSCPPADRWLSGYLNDDRLFKTLIPVALHVDYWDYIGWKDRFARPLFSTRQREYRAHGHVESVYTPGIVVDGREWRRWFVDRSRPQPALPPAGVLRLALDGDSFTARYDGEATELHVVWLGFGVTSTVSAGENRGRRFTHDFVVLDHRSYRGDASWSGELPPRGDPDKARAIAAWVSRGGDPAPLQAVAGWVVDTP